MDTSYVGMSHYARTLLVLLTRSQKTLNQTISVLAKTKGRNLLNTSQNCYHSTNLLGSYAVNLTYRYHNDSSLSFGVIIEYMKLTLYCC
jgi:hypothetical protein